MLDINLIRTKPDFVKKSLKDRGLKSALVDDFLALDESWRSLTKQVDDARARLNELSKVRSIDEARRRKQKRKILKSGYER